MARTATRSTLARAGRALAYATLGAAVTAGVALATLAVARPLQRVVYHALYLQVGPSEATEAAILFHALVSAVDALTLALLVGDALSTRLANRTVLAAAVAAMGGLALAFLLLALAHLAAFLTAVAVLAAGLVGVPVGLWYRADVRSGAIPAFAGGVPVVLALLVLVGFGLGWGWGYVVTAREVPDPPAGADASFEAAPDVAHDLFVTGYCREERGARTCSLELRGYDREVAAVRFLARHGVRCPYRERPGAEPTSFVGRYEGAYYRVTCTPHGD